MANVGIAGIEIYFEDLTPEAQRALLAYKEVNAPEELGYDELPLVVIE